MIKSYSFRMYPTNNQEVKLNKTLSTCRHLYNDALKRRKRQVELNKLERDFHVFPWGKPEWIDYYDQANELASSKTPNQREVYSQVLQDVMRRLEKNFKNFFRGFGYPRFKGRDRYNSFTYPQMGFDLKDGKLNLSKIGCIKIILHRKIEGRIKTCTIKKDVDQWYAVFTVEIEKNVESVPVEMKIGVDVGLNSLLTLSNGEKIEPPKFLRKSENKLAKEQARLSRKKRGSSNRKKQKTIVARVHRKIRNQRIDFSHKTAKTLVNQYDFIGFENLNIKGMIRNHYLAKSICDAGWYQLQIITKYKAEEAGKQVKFCIAKGTSQTCRICGRTQKITLKDRVFRCSACGNIDDRDINASNIILDRCTTGTVGTEACKSGLKRDMMKQEAPALRLE